MTFFVCFGVHEIRLMFIPFFFAVINLTLLSPQYALRLPRTVFDGRPSDRFELPPATSVVKCFFWVYLLPPRHGNPPGICLHA